MNSGGDNDDGSVFSKSRPSVLLILAFPRVAKNSYSY